MRFTRISVLVLAAVVVAKEGLPDCVWSCHQSPDVRNSTACPDAIDDICVLSSPRFAPKFQDCLDDLCPTDFLKKNPEFAQKLIEAFLEVKRNLKLTRCGVHARQYSPAEDSGPDSCDNDDKMPPYTPPPCAVYSLTKLAAAAGTECPLNQPFGSCLCQVQLAEKKVVEFCAAHLDQDLPKLGEVLQWIHDICSDYSKASDKPKDLQGDGVEDLTLGSDEDVKEKTATKIVDKAKVELEKQKKKTESNAREEKEKLMRQWEELQKSGGKLNSGKP